MEPIGYTGILIDLVDPPLEIDQNSTGYNPIVELAKETETPLHRWKESTLLVDKEGHLIATAEANKALKQVWYILEKASEYSTNHSEEINTFESLYSFFESWCDRAFERGDLTRQEMELILGMSQMWGAYVGDRIELQSLKYFYLEDCIEGGKLRTRILFRRGLSSTDDCFIPTNYQKIIARISAVPLAQADIQFNTAMVSVEASIAKPRSVTVTTSDGMKQHFDEVVVTTPLGWLKQHKDCIRQLHPRIASAIDSISFGRLEKVKTRRFSRKYSVLTITDRC